ncbi:MAG: branched-chain amino acid ABC transporter permease [Dehalococcoidia bacterium]|nr:branched-chain amino acid ABC transporter permease [Dehalococcoidia bacterium]
MLKEKKTLQFLAIAVIVVLAFLVPAFIKERYLLHVFITIFYFVILAASLLLIMMVGQMSLAHAGFVAIGAYTAGIVTRDLGWSLWVAMPLAGLTSGVIGALVGFPTLRLRGTYFLLVTFAFGSLVTLFFGNILDNVFGGVVGFRNIPAPTFELGSFKVDFIASRVPYYYLALVLALITVLAMYRLRNSRLGVIFNSIAQADGLAEHCGVNLMKYKVMAFSIACIFPGMAGAFYAGYHFVVFPADFTFKESLTTLIQMIVGGTGSLAGPVVGAAGLTIVQELLTALPYQKAIIFGGILIVVVMFLPGGLVGVPGQVVSIFRKFRRPERVNVETKPKE